MARAEWTLRETAPDLRARYLAEGLWTDDTLTTHVVRGLDQNPGLEFRVWSHTRPARYTFADCNRLARGLAAGLAARGVREGDVVAFQMPNCFEAALTFYGAAMLGVVLVPIVHFYGPKEVGYILRESGAKAFLSFDRFGSRDFVADHERAVAGADALELTAFVGSGPAGTIGFDDLVLEGADFTPVAPDPDAPAVIGYTSGTTADPKGVIHTHRTLNGEMLHMTRLGGGGDRPMLVGAPVGHAIGMQSGLLGPILRDLPIFLIDQWDPGMVLDVLLEADCTAGSGSTFFLTSLLDHPKCTEAHHRAIRQVGMGGSAVPAAVADRAEALGIKLLRSYGSTEHPSTTGSSFDDPRDQRNHTDGVPLAGVELRLVDEDGHDVPDGTPGEVWSRGPDLFVGYTNPGLTEIAVDADGWYASGDIAVRDERGAITITDRKKDIIIRGGENISAAEVEELLQQMPGISEVAVVAAPDPRLGEHACAFVRVIPGAAAPSIDDVRAHLAAAGLARQKFPEDLRVEDDLPRTPSGKIQKFVLRDRLRSEAAG